MYKLGSIMICCVRAGLVFCSCQACRLQQPEEWASMIRDLFVPHGLCACIVGGPAASAVHRRHPVRPQVGSNVAVDSGILGRVGAPPLRQEELTVVLHAHVRKEQSLVTELAPLHGCLESDGGDGDS